MNDVKDNSVAEVRKHEENDASVSTVLIGSTRSERIHEAFEKTLLLMDPLSREFMANLKNDEKLKLYGLYKHIRKGPCTDVTPSIWQVEEYYKHQSYNGNREKLVDDAMLEYVNAVVTMTENRSNMKDLHTKCVSMAIQWDDAPDTEPSPGIQLQKRQAIYETKQPKLSMRKAPLASVLKSASKAITNITGVRPLIPRGQLDISYLDLIYGVSQCVGTHDSCIRLYEQKIEKQWIAGTSKDARVITGLAVRSLFDLYFRVQKFPPGSEVIMSPPINVPAMVHVMKYHNIKIIGVDIPDSEGKRGQTVSVNVEGIEKAISARTVAIMVVHPFGIISASDDDMQRIRTLADNCGNTVHVIEDNSEVYSGLTSSYSYVGSQYADICFYSFGLIKAATALGGGIAVIRNAAELDDSGVQIPKNRTLFESMDRFHHLQYKFQTNWEFFQKIMKAVVLRFFGDMPLLYGFLRLLYGIMFGPDAFDRLVTSLIRGYFDYKGVHDGGKSKVKSDNGPDMLLIRKRPSPALLSLMYRRFTQRDIAGLVRKKVERCEKLTKAILNDPNTDLRVPVPRNGLNNYFWIYPVLSTNRTATSKLFVEAGFDATFGATQLCCIPCDDESTYPNARALMDQTVYLPIAGPLFPDDLAHQITKAALYKPKKTTKKQRHIGLSTASTLGIGIVVLLAGWFLQIEETAIYSALHAVAIAFGVATIATVLWYFFCNSWFGPFYMSTPSVFATTHDMIVDMSGSIEERKAVTAKKHSIIDSLDVLKIGESLPRSRGQVVFLTGGSGYVGSKILHDLLLFREQLGFSLVVVLCRQQRNVSAKDRIFKMLEDDMFSFLSTEEKNQYVRVVNGDVTMENAGIDAADLEVICNQYVVSHVIHAAAAVSFNQSFPDAAKSNITSTLCLQKLATKLNQGQKLAKTKFVHISTAFVHGNMTGTRNEPLCESLFDLGNFNPQELYQSMVGTQFYASQAYNELGFPNTYTFSKCICEHLLTLYKDTMQTIIIRPSIVGPAVESPYEGWAGKTPSTIVAAATLQMAVPWNLWCCGPTNATVVPVDVVSRFVLAKAFCKPSDDDSAKSEESSDDDYDKVSKDSAYDDRDSSSSFEEGGFQDVVFHHATWNVHSPDSTKFNFKDYFVAGSHLCNLMRTINQYVLVILLFQSSYVMPSLGLSQEMFEKLHTLTVMVPVELVCKILDLLGIDNPLLKKIMSVINLPTLFYHFMTNEFYFKSSLRAPIALNGERYMLSCLIAAHKFITDAKEKMQNVDPTTKPNVKRYEVVGPWANQQRGLLWALSQPRGSVLFRLAGWLLAQIFHCCCSEVTVDIASFIQVNAVMKAHDGHKRIILAPTHRSYFDFLLVSYVCFCLPELLIEIPHIVAADDFAHLPFLGTIARLLRAIFISRTKTNVDPNVQEQLNKIEQRANGCGFAVEVFIEGTRSRDRRFAKPKTGVLKCLQQNGGGSLVVPIAISYERLPEQASLSCQADGGMAKGMSVSGLISWLIDVYTGKVRLGKIHLSACKPLEMNESVKSINCLVDEIQLRQQEKMYISSYHIEATARLLQLESSEVRTAFNLIGIPFWPCKKTDEDFPDLPVGESELFTIFLQASPFLAPLFHYSHPKWAKWLNRLTYRKNVLVKTDPTLSNVVSRLSKLFDDADLCVDLCHSELVAHGFTSPSHSHLIGTVLKSNKQIPLILISASISMKFPEIGADKIEKYSPVQIIRKTVLQEEALGFWGFHDSAFVVRMDKRGKPYVSMEGSRYGFEGKKITKLIPFIETVTDLKMNPNNEAFQYLSNRQCSDCKLSKGEMVELNSLVLKVSISVDERIRHGTGHCQEDIFAVREGRLMRVPDAVVWPETEEEVEALVLAAKEHNWCLFPFGGGTNVSQATKCPSLRVEPRPIISVDMKKMDKILYVDEENGLAHIEAGITGRVLEEKLRKQGYTMGHEPDSIEFSTLGGWIATKASGMKRSKYGNIEDIVMSVRVAGARGVLQHGKKNGAWGREACGLDLRSLIIGSEGCLGIIISSVVRIQPLAVSKSYDSVLFQDFDAGYKFMHGISRQKARLPSCVRLLDNEHFRLGMAMKPDDSSIVTAMKKSALGAYLKLTGQDFNPYQVVCATISYEGTRDEVKEQIEAVKKLASLCGGIRLGAEVGKAGYALTFMIAYLRDFAMTYNILGESFETFVPWTNIKEVIEKTKLRIKNEHASRYLPGKPFIGARITQLYHEGACLYFYFCMNIENVENGSHVYSEIEHAARLEILANGGSISHHHGLGKVRSHYLKQINSAPLLETMKAVKQGIDPENVFGARNGPFAVDD